MFGTPNLASFSLASACFNSLTPPSVPSKRRSKHHPPLHTDQRTQDWPVMDWKTATAISAACEFFFPIRIQKLCFGDQKPPSFPVAVTLRRRPSHSPRSLFSKKTKKTENAQKTSAASSAASAS